MSYAFNSIVSSQEQEALKSMIFKRAQERAQALVEDVEETYTSSVKSDIMDVARASFVSNKNPFSIGKKEENPVLEEISPQEKSINESKNNIESIKNNIYQKQKAIQSDIAEKVMILNMSDARGGLEKRKQSFVGALDFLNSQASISLINKKTKGFDALA